jgi:transaldolase/glucose-6-phosphate isomerase
MNAGKETILKAHLGAEQEQVEAAIAAMQSDHLLARIEQHDHRVWKPDPQEISNRLGWMDIAARIDLTPIHNLLEQVQEEGYTHALLLGMGGSSLAPELFAQTFPAGERFSLQLSVQDSTDPGAVLEAQERLDPEKTLFIVSTKSGSTVETLSFFKFFYNWTAETLGVERAGAHFIAITDPGSKLVDLAAHHHFRQIFLNDPHIGGRYSALSYFGLVPAALCGVDLQRLLERARQMMLETASGVPTEQNPAAQLGAIVGVMARQGRDKATFITSGANASFGDWVEQLIAESSGKAGKGILPVVHEAPGVPAVYGDDRVFFDLRMKGDDANSQAVQDLRDSGYPVVEIALEDVYDLGGQFYLWELATAIAGHLLDINPFDQPNVESAKVRARQMVAAYKESGQLPAQTPLLSDQDIAVYGPESAASLDTEWTLTSDTAAGALAEFLSQARTGDYIALQAFVQPEARTSAALQTLRLKLRDEYRLATSFGYGPRFLHSTGQLHKGDGGNGLFIQITADDARDAQIPEAAITPGGPQPGSSISFGVLIAAQAMGDRKALEEVGRRVLRLHVFSRVDEALRKLMEEFGE